jgi:hypothetical protein
MILEDDVIPMDPNLDRLKKSLKTVPDDRDFIRFDCWVLNDFDFQWVNEYVIDTSEYWTEERCKKCKIECPHDKLCGRPTVCGRESLGRTSSEKSGPKKPSIMPMAQSLVVRK